MSAVELTGHLICTDEREAQCVRRHLSRHIELTRAEDGCLHFAVLETDDPLVWSVSEIFADEASFTLHQERVRSSEWGRATAGITRDYVVTRSDS